MTISEQDILQNTDYISHSTTVENLSYLLKRVKKGELIIDFDVFLPTKNKNLQRGFVWSYEKKNLFILQVLRTYGVSGSISMFDKLRIVFRKEAGVEYWEVIDGKQRLTTMFDFIEGKIPVTVGEKVAFFADLSPNLQGTVRRFWFNADLARYEDMTDEKRIEWFGINFLGEAQDVEHYNSLKLQNEWEM